MQIKIFTLFIGDVLLMLLSLWLTLLARYGSESLTNAWIRHFWLFLPVFIVWLTVFYIEGFYDWRKPKKGLIFYSHFLRDLAINGISAITLFYFFSNYSGLRPQRLLLIYLLIFSILFYLWRQLSNKLLKTGTLVNRVAILGSNDGVKELVAAIKKQSSFGYQLIGLIKMADSDIVEENLKNLILANDPSDLPNIIKKEKINILVTSGAISSDPRLTQIIFSCLPQKIDIINLASFYEDLTGKILIKNITPEWLWEKLAENKKRAYEYLRRFVDILLALIFGIFSLILLTPLAILIKLSDNGPVFFKQIRSGLNGKNFLAIKLRTMKVDAESNGPQWAQTNDPRVTKVGKFLRKSRLDEIPQLYNILKGEMSFVGPRPERPEFIKTLEEQIPFYRQRLLVKPGLTGWAQINSGYSGSLEGSLEKLQYDLYYIKNRSLILDLSIILKTIKIVLSGGGQ